MPTRSFLVITTGGTIAGNVADEHHDYDSLRSEYRVAQILAPTIERLQQIWGVTVSVTAREVINVDSSDILPEHWTALADTIAQHYDEHDGFIVTHGTNTMGYTCAALSFALANLNKPVVITGSQVPFGLPASDALMNLDNALRVAAYPYDSGIRGVVCVFGSCIITGTRAKKRSEFDLDAFESYQSGRLGTIGRIMQMNAGNVSVHHSYLAREAAPALLQRDLLVRSAFDTRILSLTEVPGMGPELLLAALVPLIESSSPLLRGIVFRAFGAGDVSRHLHPVFEYLAEHEVPVVVTTQAPAGNSNFRVNEPGLELGRRGLGIASYDMSIETITAKLAWLLARGVSYSQMSARIQEDLHGEINVFADRV